MSIISNKRIKSIKLVEYKKRYLILLMEKFVNLLMSNGKKSVAFDIFCQATYEFSLKTKNHSPAFPTASVKQEKNLLGKCHPFVYLREKKQTKLELEKLSNNKKGVKRGYSNFSGLFSPQGLLGTKERKVQRLPVNTSGKERNKMLLQLNSVINNVRPSIEGRKCRVAGTSKLIPATVPHKRSCSIAMRWIIESAIKRKKTNKLPMSLSLAQEFLDAYQGQGRPRQRRDQLYRACEGNRGFLRYKWW